MAYDQMRDPWQLYMENENGDSLIAYNALEEAWTFAKTLPEARMAADYMDTVMRQHADAGAYDSEGFQELDRRLRRIWPDWN